MDTHGILEETIKPSSNSNMSYVEILKRKKNPTLLFIFLMSSGSIHSVKNRKTKQNCNIRCLNLFTGRCIQSRSMSSSTLSHEQYGWTAFEMATRNAYLLKLKRSKVTRPIPSNLRSGSGQLKPGRPGACYHGGTLDEPRPRLKLSEPGVCTPFRPNLLITRQRVLYCRLVLPRWRGSQTLQRVWTRGELQLLIVCGFDRRN